MKNNIGHLDAAAGVTGLIKTALALHHKILPPTIHFDAPNPALDLPASPFFVSSELTPWVQQSGLRRAGVSSLGAGGTNAHVVLEEAPPPPPPAAARPEQLILLSARTAPALDESASLLRAHLAADTDAALADIAYTLQVGRRRFDHRRAIVATSREDAIALLLESDATSVANDNVDTRHSPVAFLFPGQGAQQVNMGRALYETEPVFRAQIDECAELLRPHLDKDLRAILYPTDGEVATAQEELTQTAVTQPALSRRATRSRSCGSTGASRPTA